MHYRWKTTFHSTGIVSATVHGGGFGCDAVLTDHIPHTTAYINLEDMDEYLHKD